MRLLKQVLSFALDFFLIYAKFIDRKIVNLSDLSKMLVQKQIKYFVIAFLTLDHARMESSEFTRSIKYKNK